MCAGRGDDRVDLAREREPDRGLDGVPGEPARADGPRSCHPGRSPLPCPQVPTGTRRDAGREPI